MRHSAQIDTTPLRRGAAAAQRTNDAALRDRNGNKHVVIRQAVAGRQR